jgi:GntR family transcriptional regulator
MTAVPPIDQVDSSLLTDRTRRAILKAILEDRFGERLPSEDVLAQQLGVSRTTVRAALQNLERHGLIARTRAIGTTINRHVGPATLALHRLVGFDWLLRELGYEVEIQIRLAHGSLEDKTAVLFQLEPGIDCCIMEKDYLANGEVAIFIRDIVPWASLRDQNLSEDDLTNMPDSIFEFVERYTPYTIDHAVLVLVPSLKGEGLSTGLAVAPGRPFLRLVETHYTKDVTRVGFSVIDICDELLRLELYRKR